MYQFSEDQLTAIKALSEMYASDLKDAVEVKDAAKIEEWQGWMGRLDRAIERFKDEGSMRDADIRDFKIGISKCRKRGYVENSFVFPFTDAKSNVVPISTIIPKRSTSDLIDSLKKKNTNKSEIELLAERVANLESCLIEMGQVIANLLDTLQ